MRAPGFSPNGTAWTRAFREPEGAERYPARFLDGLASFDRGAETLQLAWELARWVPGLPPPERDALVLVALASLVNLAEGSTYLPLGAAFDGLAERLGGTADERARARALLVDPRLSLLAGGPAERKPLVLDGDRLYLRRIRDVEDRLADDVRRRLRRPARRAPAEALEAALADLAARPIAPRGVPVAASAEQLEAVRAAVSGSLTLVTGGPGTGKTSILVSLLRLVARLGEPVSAVALAAPTGKAASRMTESVLAALRSLPEPADADRALLAAAPEARTLHRLLGYSPAGERFRHHAGNPLAEKLVVVDEASMIDLFLMGRLFRALASDARLVLLGDADQLPSVEAGAAFRDLASLQGPGAGVVRLRTSYRMDERDPAGRAILAVAAAIDEGRSGALFGGDAPLVARREAAAQLAGQSVEWLAGSEPDGRAQPEGSASPLADFWRRWGEQLWSVEAQHRAARPLVHRRDGGRNGFADEDAAALRAHHGRMTAQRVLCLTREHPETGASAVNRRLHEIALARDEHDGAEGRASFLPGEPILMSRNDYDRGLWNGDEGLVVRLVGEEGAAHGRRRPALMALFPKRDGYAVFPLDSMRGEIELAYAMTVHKAQGSEFDRVALLLPDAPIPLLTREVLYTAVSRARRSVVLLGSPDVLRAGVDTPIRRFSSLREWLAGVENG